MKKHRLIGTEACSYGNSCYSYSDGYDFVYCSCGWRGTAHGRHEHAMVFAEHISEALQGQMTKRDK